MRLLFVADPLESFSIYKDSTYAMMVEAQNRGHAVSVCGPQDLALVSGRVLAVASNIRLDPAFFDDRHREGAWWRGDLAIEAPLTAFGAVLMRKDPPFDMEYVYATYLLEHAQRQGARVFNDPRAIRDHNEKLAIAQFEEFTAPTIVTRDAQRLRDFVAANGDAVLKPLDGMGGSGIFRVRADDPNLNVIVETLNQFGARTVMAQRYIPEIRDGDKRVLLIGGQPVPYALARIPKAGESRGNLAAGGRGEARELTARDREIAASLGPRLAARGLLLVGLDVIGNYLTEVNVTSPTCFREIMDQTGFDVAGMFVDALERAAERGADAPSAATPHP